MRHLILEDGKFPLVVVELCLQFFICFFGLVKLFLLSLRPSFDILLTLLEILPEVLVLAAELAYSALGSLILLKELLLCNLHLHLQILLESILVGFNLLFFKS